MQYSQLSRVTAISGVDRGQMKRSKRRLACVPLRLQNTASLEVGSGDTEKPMKEASGVPDLYGSREHIVTVWGALRSV